MDDFSRNKIELPTTEIEFLQADNSTYNSPHTMVDTSSENQTNLDKNYVNSADLFQKEIPQTPESVLEDLQQKNENTQKNLPAFVRNEINDPKKWGTFTNSFERVLQQKRYGKTSMKTDTERFYDPQKEVAVKINNGWNQIKEDDFTDVQSDQFLGEFRVTGNYVEIKLHDHGREDNDQVNVTNNDEIIYSKVVLKNYVKTIRIPLSIGFNHIHTMALNRGQLGPNTGAISLWDTQQNKLMQGAWNYNTGSKNKILVIREE